MKIIAIALATAVALYAVPLQAMPAAQLSKAPAVSSTVDTVSTRVSKRSSSGSQAGSSLLSLPLNLNVLGVAGLSTRLGVGETYSSSYQSKSFKMTTGHNRGRR